MHTDSLLLDIKESRHALRLLRLKTGEKVQLLDGDGHAAEGTVAGVKQGRLQVSVSAPEASRLEGAQALTITLGISVIKPQAMDLLVQKCSELGVAQIQPLIT